ncbi:MULTISPECIES: electron transport complex subunit RsxB [unclassified Pseudomonas]|uniref:electron transport complex subunit RsxB n=1 Tax=unclassified Pseudomonas TaxID=196821 RepID=UPI000EAA08A2|nr:MULTISPECIES: electron transport complex subunit RsxB [unclassified Pseudomonas]AYF85732.1 electron transport complex subunit RsxB [Pseudomonas sp. DY-1]MDH4654919.1 electron transport complex subunit RsxB [Pseudomonas sp. BN606]MRK19410.1 electron transport complex subunit RsxB [Pseudomonas sp. JG-B]
MSQASLIQSIDALLPQTQCGKCGHPGCKPYAEGIAQGEAINKCPPGGSATIHALADLLKVQPLPLDAPNGPVPPQIAFIREAECIGCTKCIQACPVDAIVGAAKQMHTVITDECTGCELCVAPCPVDCIDILPLAEPAASAQRQHADQFRQRFEFRNARLARDDARRRAEREARAARAAEAQQSTAAAPLDAVQAAIERVKAQKAATPSLSDQQKRLKIEAAMAQVALKKAEDKLEVYGTSDLQALVVELRAANEKAQAALKAALEDAAPQADEATLKQAKIAAAMSRTQLARAEKAFGESPTEDQQAQLVELRAAVEQAQQRLDAAHGSPAAPAPISEGEARLKQAKIALASHRAALKSAEHRGANAAELASLRLALADAETALHTAEDASGKQPPNLQRIEKRPVDPAMRAIKTELAYARADLSKLERQPDADPAALAQARERLHKAEQALNEQPRP